MKKVFLATTAIVALAAGSAGAADMAVKARPLPPPPPACAQFGGGYIGANVGWGYYDHRYHDKDGLASSIDDGLPVNVNRSNDGWNGGAQIGYNWQSRCTVFGLEADWSWTNLKVNETFFDGDAGTQDALTVNSRMRSFGTVRARSGVVVDNLFLYVTGGLAFARFNRDFTFFEDGGPVSVTHSQSRTRWGWTTGVGGEWALSSNWSVKSEFLYMRFQRDELSAPAVTIAGVNIGVPGRNYRLENEDQAWVTRIGLNYRWGGGPVVANY